jgi:hypothetical protein
MALASGWVDLDAVRMAGRTRFRLDPSGRPRRAAAAIVVVSFALVGAFASPAWATSDKQIARASTLRISDFPSGWTTSPHTESPPSKLRACRPTLAAEKNAKPYKVAGPNFGLSSGGTQTAQVTNVVYVFPSVKQARAYLAAFQLPTAEECLQARLDKAMLGSPLKAAVTTLDLTGSPADDEVGLGAIVPSSIDTVYYQAVAFRVGRGVTAFTTQNVAAPLPDTPSLAATGIARLRSNLAAP